jgi:VPDSG-CTERM motif
MIKQLTTITALAALAALTPQAHAAFISGTVDFIGTAAIDGSGPLSATAFTSFSNVTVDFGTGVYSGTMGASATIQPFSFNPPSGPITGLWSFTQGSTTYSFDLATLVKDFQGVPADAPGLGTIRVSGTGVAHATGLSDTPASFVLHASGGLADLQLAFGASTTTLPPGVPDGGSTMAMLACGLVGIGFVRRKLIK